MNRIATPRLDGWLGSRAAALVIALAMLASTPGLTPSASAQDVEDSAVAAEVGPESVEATPTEAPVEPVVEPVVDQAPIEEMPVVEPQPPVEESPLVVEEVVPTETVPIADETVPAEEPVGFEETPAPVEETPAAAEPTPEPTVPAEEAAAPPTAGKGIASGSPESSGELSGAGLDEASFGAAAVNLTVALTLSPTGSPVAGTSVTATASWANASAGAATGTVHYRAFTGSGCTGALYAAAGTKSIVATTFPSGSAPASDAVVMNAAGAHSWQAAYSGDVNYNPSTVCTNQTIAKRTPTIALAVSPSPSTAGDVLTGTSNLANLTTTASGNLTYTLYTNNTCGMTLAATGSPNVKAVSGGVAPASDAITVNYVPTVYWRAVYAGDANNNTITSACVAVTMAKRSPTLSIAVTSVSGAAGQPAFNQATLVNATSNAIGTVTYGIYTNNTCTTTFALTGNTHTKTVAAGVVPVSNSLTINVLTTYWKASYGGDAYNNIAASPCFLLTLVKASPTISLTVAAVSAPMKAAGTARGTATLSSSGSTAATTTAIGNAGYTVYTESTCSTVLVAVNNKAVANRLVPVSSNLTINQAGFVYWKVVYAGDANNNGASSACVALAVAKSDPTSTLAFTLGATPMKAGGTARARGTFGTTTTTSTATGTLTYSVFTNNTCTTLFTVSGNPHTKTVTNRSTGTSNSLTFPEAATYYWRMDFAGDANNNAAQGPCTALVVAKSTPTLTLAVSPSPGTTGGPVTGAATLTLAGATAGGTVTYTVYTDGACSTTLTVAGSPSTVTVTNRTVPNSAGITFGVLNTYFWRAAYAGDANNGAATSACVPNTIDKATPIIALSTSPSGSVFVGGSAMGTATMTNASATAGGDAIYTLYSDAGCTATLGVAGNPSTRTVVNRVVPNSASFTFNTVGTFYWQVRFAGDNSNNQVSSSCVALAVVKRSPTVGLTVTGSASPLVTGGTATGAATFLGATATASGSVVYTVFADNLCTTAAVPSRTSTRGVTNAAVANSGAFTFATAGTFYWSAVYGGDAGNNAATSACVALNVVNPAVVTLDLIVNPASIVVGATARGQGSLTGVTATAGGTVIYTVYADSTCATSVTPATSSTVTVTNGAMPPSTSFPFAQAGTLYWSAVYGGDANNLGDTSPCVVLTVAKASPTIALSVSPNPVAAGNGATGTATLTGASSTAGGTATFTVYVNNICTTQVTPNQSSTKTVSGAVVPVSAALTVQAAGTIYWRVVYAGDANNNGATSTCLAVTVTKANPSVSLTLSSSSIAVFGSASASASLTSATTGAGGTLDYVVYADAVCSLAASPAKSTSRTVTNGTVPASASFQFVGSGVFYWKATYGGDANNLATESGCLALTVVAGNLTASVASVTLAPVSFSGTQQTNVGTMTLSVADRRGTSEGWSVTLSVSDFIYSGASPIGANIPAGAFSIQTAHGPVLVQGQAINPVEGPVIPAGGAAGPLDAPIVVLVAADGYGAGDYTQTFDVALVIPAGSQAGTYTAVVDTTTSAAP